VSLALEHLSSSFCRHCKWIGFSEAGFSALLIFEMYVKWFIPSFIQVIMKKSKKGECSMSEIKESTIMEALEDVVDPELGIDIVNLGLVYGVDVGDQGDVIVTMTLTAMGCPLSASIEYEIKRVLMPIEGVNSVEVNIVWNPPWSKDNMSRYAKIALGIS